MTEAPRYVIVGRGRWAGRMQRILAEEGREVVLIGEPRRRLEECDASYRFRLSASMRASGAQITWICLPPGAHIPLIAEAAISAGLHVVIEKPWLCSCFETDALLALAEAQQRVIGVHHEYCFLQGVEGWRRDFRKRGGLNFGGRFRVSGPNRLGIDPVDDLGSHLLAIRAYAVPHAEVSEILCGYDLPDERRVWLEVNGREVAVVDFLNNSEPIIQRFVSKFEDAVAGAEFPLDLRFALRVAEDLEHLKSRTTTSDAGQKARPT